MFDLTLEYKEVLTRFLSPFEVLRQEVQPEVQNVERGSVLQNASQFELRRSELLHASGIDDRLLRKHASCIDHRASEAHCASGIDHR